MCQRHKTCQDHESLLTLTLETASSDPESVQHILKPCMSQDPEAS